MKLKARLKNLHFYTITISIGMLIFSLLCWINLFENTNIINYLERLAPWGNEEVISEDVSFNEEIGTLEEIHYDVEAESDPVVLDRQDFLQTEMEQINLVWNHTTFKRGYLSRMDSQATYLVIGEILSSEVLYGNDNWLFYRSKQYGSDPIADYEGTNPYTDSEMAGILKSSLKVQNEMKNRGIDFVIFVPPNKENVYSEYMPDIYKHAETSSTDLLTEYLAKEGVNIINPKEELLNYHTEYQLYYSYDTHWNQLGAYIGVKSILDSWGTEIPPIQDRIISERGLKGNYHVDATDDLAAIVGLRSKFDDDMEYEIEGTVKMNWKQYQEVQDDLQVSYYENPDAENDGTLLLIGDSFRSSMLPSLREVYKNVYVLHITYFKPEMLDEINPDYVIVEYVERNSRNIEGIDDLFQW